MPYFGKFRGKVVDNIDPLGRGRIQPVVPAVADEPLNWAVPAMPYAGPGIGLFALPPVGANVWIEFEGGDVSFPIWTGCFWGTESVQAPPQPALPSTVTLKTSAGAISVDDLAGELKVALRSANGETSLVMNSRGIQLRFNDVYISLTAAGIVLSQVADIR